MEREIKFRLWDKERNAWHRDNENAVHILGENIVMQYILMRPDDSYAKLEEIPNLVVMQFTGLLDKNTVEIYEGDILKINGGADDWFATVGFEHGCFVTIDHNKVEGSSNCVLKYRMFGMSEVVGNIYENPELQPVKP